MATTKKGRWMGMRWVLLLLLVFSLGLSGCDDESDSDTCSGAQIEPHQSPVIFGELYPLGSNEEDLASSSHTPYEWVLQLRSLCSEDVEIEKVCLIGEADKNGNDVGQYIIEGPLPTTATYTESAAVRITYNRQEPNAEGDADNVTLVVESNAENYPTLLVHLCARVVPEGQEKATFDCTAAVEIEQSDQKLCE